MIPCLVLLQRHTVPHISNHCFEPIYISWTWHLYWVSLVETRWPRMHGRHALLYANSRHCCHRCLHFNSGGGRRKKWRTATSRTYMYMYCHLPPTALAEMAVADGWWSGHCHISRLIIFSITLMCGTIGACVKVSQICTSQSTYGLWLKAQLSYLKE